MLGEKYFFTLAKNTLESEHLEFWFGTNNLQAKQLPASTLPMLDWQQAAQEPAITPAQPKPTIHKTKATAIGPVIVDKMMTPAMLRVDGKIP